MDMVKRENSPNQLQMYSVVSNRANIQAAQLLLTECNFSYVLPGVFADEAQKSFFDETRQRSDGNF